MNILYINHYAGSPRHGMEFRPYYLAREWVRAGHRVKIVAGSHSHVRSVQPQVSGQVTQELIDGIEYRWMATPPYLGNGVGRVRNIATFLWRVWRETNRHVRQVQARRGDRLQHLPDGHLGSRGASPGAPARKLVHEVHDLWPLSPIELSGMSPTHPFIRLCQKAEDDACRGRRRRDLDAAEGGRPPAISRARPAQAAHRAETASRSTTGSRTPRPRCPTARSRSSSRR